MAHLYWRLYCTDSPNGSYAAFAEIEMHSTNGGAQLCTGGTATSSSNYSGAYTPDHAFNGSLTDLWHSGSGLPQWVAYQFPSAVDVVELYCWARSSENGVCPTSFALQYSDDGVTWTTLASISGMSAWSNGEKRTFRVSGTDLVQPSTFRVNTQYAYVVTQGGKGLKVNTQYAYIVARGGKGLKVNTQYAYVIGRFAVSDPGGGGGGGGTVWIRAAQIIG